MSVCCALWNELSHIGTDRSILGGIQLVAVALAQKFPSFPSKVFRAAPPKIPYLGCGGGGVPE